MSQDNEEPVQIQREDLIATAIKFLTNHNVQRSAISQKQQFLRAKGLTEDEIQIACERAGVFNGAPAVPVSPSSPMEHSHTLTVDTNLYAMPQQSRLSRFRDILNSIALLSGLTYAIYLFYKNYIKPFLFGSKNDKKRKSLEESVQELNENVSKNVKELSDSLSIVKIEVSKISSQDSTSTSRQIQELKSEIGSLKSLLLGRKQFPSVATVVPPSIPAWQLTSSQQDGDDVGEGDSECMKNDDLLDSGSGSGSSETEVATKNSDSSLEIIS